MEETRNGCRVLVKKHVDKWALGRPRTRWEYNLEWILTVSEDERWVQRLNLVLTLLKLWVPLPEI
jgi:hypothetical protein